ncbi:hypothetical protein M3T53_04605 [Actinomyces sp. B33]|uniref:zinc ribbon domain-containing protein n=1 Tax=Actinomyces sp. B33 TaxID=2942131 RepID=UPI002341C664|nr:hypothetical protein [Actinomyces sp. B33]MDC4232992.1 hypothetical protein [Actinomyces sp. B33]
MNASHQDQLLLLDLQDLDRRESSLRHRRDSHPAHATVRELAGRAEDLQRAAIAQTAVISDIGREITRIEDELAKVSERRARQQGRIEANQVPLRDISSMEHEIAQMDLRLRSLENDQLAAEERREAAEAARTAMRDEAAAIAADVEAAKASFAEDTAATDEELREVIARRRDLAASVPAGLLDEYEHARSRNGVLAVLEVRDGYGVGVAADLSPLELEQIRLTPDDRLYITEDTQQIVVRTLPGERA